MAELQTRPATPDKSETTKDAEDRKIAALRKTYDEVAKSATEAAKYGGDTGPAYIALRTKKAEAAKALHDAEDAQGKRVKEEAASRRAAQPNAKP